MLVAELSLGIRSLLFPARCPGCGGAPEDPGADPLCAACRARLPWAGPVRLPRPSALDGAVSVWRYEGAAQELVQALKYRGTLSLAPYLAREMARALRGRPAADAVTAVPLHPTRLRERTFNQAEALACRLAGELGLPYRPGLLRRRLPTRAQPGLAREERFRNVRDAFHAEPDPSLQAARLLLVDDVLTTGATAQACARALKRAGAAHVTVVTLARG